MCLSVLIIESIIESDAVSSIFKKLTLTPCPTLRHYSMLSLKVENRTVSQVRKQLYIASSYF